MHMRNANLVKNDRGQTVIIFALIMPVLILFTGLALDAGLLYVTKAKLSTSVDAACLTGMKNLALTQPVAATLATDMFNANFGPNPPIPTVTFPLDAAGDQQVKVTATASVNTLFMRYLSQWKTVPVSAIAVSTRGKLVMSIVLDRSGSMSSDGGGAALQAAVPAFVSNFDDIIDHVALISFSSNARIDFSMANHFKTPIDNAVAAMNFAGGTFGTGAGTQPIFDNLIGAPLSLAKLQDDSILPAPGQNLIKVVVYFTDGLMNASQDNFHCGGKNNNTLTLVNYGGQDSGTPVMFFDPSCSPSTSDLNSGCTNKPGNSVYGYCDSGNCYDRSGNPTKNGGFAYDAAADGCVALNGNPVTKFLSQQTGNQTAFARANVTGETQYRANQTAIALRTDTILPTVYIYTIGLNDINHPMASSTKDFLAQLANDPDPKYPLGTYIQGQPAGEFFYIPDCPGASCTPELTTVFQTIAAKILLRLTQ